MISHLLHLVLVSKKFGRAIPSVGIWLSGLKTVSNTLPTLFTLVLSQEPLLCIEGSFRLAVRRPELASDYAITAAEWQQHSGRLRHANNTGSRLCLCAETVAGSDFLGCSPEALLWPSLRAAFRRGGANGEEMGVPS